MSEDHRNKLETLGIIVVVSLLLLPAALGESPSGGSSGDPVRIFLYDFQTLITGVLAILAAKWTISQMRASDRRQAAEMRRVNYLTHRATLVTVDRYVVEAAKRLEFVHERGLEFGRIYTRVTNTRIWTKADKDTYLLLVRSTLLAHERLENIDKEAAVLLTTSLNELLRLFTEVTKSVRRHVTDPDKLFDMYANSDHAPMYYSDELGELLLQIPVPASWLIKELASWREDVFAAVVNSGGFYDFR